jgi:uncharacterized protein (DUF302 family)
MLIKVTTEKTIEAAAASLELAVQANQFGVMHVHDLKQTMQKKGIEFAQDCLVFEVCNPLQAKKVLEANMSVSTALPCRISIYRENGKTTLATLKPSTLLAMFQTPPKEGLNKSSQRDSLASLIFPIPQETCGFLPLDSGGWSPICGSIDLFRGFLIGVARDVEATMIKIMQEAAIAAE